MKVVINTVSHNLDDIIDRYQPMTEDEEKAMIESCGEDIEMRNELLVLHNLAFAINFVKNYTDRTEEREDFIMRGVEGLCNAAKNFDQGKGNRFCTFAGFYIMKAMSDLFSKTRSGPKTQAITSAMYDSPIESQNKDDKTLGDYLSNNAKAPDWNPPSPNEYELKSKEKKEVSELIEYLVDRFSTIDSDKDIIRRYLLGEEYAEMARELGMARWNVQRKCTRVISKIRKAIETAKPGSELYNIICRAVKKRPRKIDANALFAFMAGNDIILTDDEILEDLSERAERMMDEYKSAELEHQIATGRLGGGEDYDLMRMVYDDMVIHKNAPSCCAEKRGISVQSAMSLCDKAVAMVKDHKSGRLERLHEKGAKADHAMKDELFNVVDYEGYRPGVVDYERLECRYDSRKFGKRGRITTWKRFGGGFYSQSNYLRLKHREVLGNYRISRREAAAMAQFCEDVPAWAS